MRSSSYRVVAAAGPLKAIAGSIRCACGPGGASVLKSPRVRCLAVALVVPMLYGQAPVDRHVSAIAQHAEVFQQKARLIISDETVVQRSYKLPAHRHFAIGAAAEPVFAAFFVS